MGKITIMKYKKGSKEYKKYLLTLPKDKMDLVNITKGDELVFISETAGVYSFQLRRGQINEA